MLAELLFAAILALVGSLTLGLLAPGLGRTPLVGFGGITGLILIAIPAAIAVMFGQPMGPFWAAGAVVALGFLTWFRRNFLSDALWGAAIAAAATSIVTLVVTLLVAPLLTFDSWRFLEYGSSLFDDGHGVGTLQQVFATYPLLLTSAQGAVRSLGIPVIASGFSSVGLMACIGAIAMMLSRPRSSLARLGLVAVAALAVASSSYLLRVQLGYVNSHVVAAGVISMAVAGCFAGRAQLGPTSGDRDRAWLVAIACCGLGLARVEGLVVIGLIVAAAVSARDWQTRSLYVLGGVGIGIPVAWYGVLAAVGASGDILSPIRIVVMAAVAIAPLGLRSIVGPRWSRRWIAPLSLAGLGLAAALLYLARPEVFEDSVRSIVLNLAVGGLWGGVWWVLLPLGLLSLLSLKVHLSPWLLLTYGYLILIVLFGGVREFPYRAGWGDSGNRMMVHVVPVFVMLAIAAFGRRPVSNPNVSASE